mmetsp:Transcript_30953/g.65312  ORF Transcript_30953/g.65312 Transcript_30953/m.65312 type:complete len:265 (+) Transcript_30953:1202-1996(+)
MVPALPVILIAMRIFVSLVNGMGVIPPKFMRMSLQRIIAMFPTLPTSAIHLSGNPPRQRMKHHKLRVLPPSHAPQLIQFDKRPSQSKGLSGLDQRFVQEVESRGEDGVEELHLSGGGDGRGSSSSSGRSSRRRGQSVEIPTQKPRKILQKLGEFITSVQGENAGYPILKVKWGAFATEARLEYGEGVASVAGHRCLVGMFMGSIFTPCLDVSGSGRGSGGRGSRRDGGASAGVEFERGRRSSSAFGFLGHDDETVVLKYEDDDE